MSTVSWYEERVLPVCIDLVCGLRQMSKQRARVVPRASGVVLEVGMGSGLNLPWYDPARVSRVFGLEPSEGMRQKARPRVAASGLDVEFIDLPGEEIPLGDASVDTVLVTYTLCTIPDVARALRGMRRVLRPGGRLLYCEHGLAPDPGVRRWQERLNGAWSRVAGGCSMTRDIPALISAAGFEIEDDQRRYIAGPRILSYTFWGSARPA